MGERIRLRQEKPGARVNCKTVGLNKTRSQSNQSPVDRILNLQRTIGNQAVTRLIQTGAIQASLKIGQPGDIYEKEADRVAEQVMRMPDQAIQRQAEEEEEEKIQTKPLADQITPLVQRQVVPEEEEEPVQAKLRDDSLLQRQVEEEEEEPIQAALMENRQLQRQEEEDIESRIQSMKGGGQPLPETTRAFFEPRFGADFSQVRVHTDSRAVQTARALNAQAYTTGNNIVFNNSQYAPGTNQGKRLLAHELTHVVQQKKSPNSHQAQQLIQTRKTITITRNITRGSSGCCSPNQTTCCTLGSASINGRSVGYTLELPDCGNRRNVSRIPAGTYTTTEVANHSRFGYCLRLHNVTGRSGILIHVGNSPRDTTGCILPGQSRSSSRCWVSNSRAALRQYRSIINSDPQISTVIS
jgi:hypothetical protein